uniref:Sodium/myo-inositol cotransporter 2 n=1 Tax=Lygus hesperus TaxID=30085 RepID=A0A0A9VRW5_LYGHE
MMKLDRRNSVNSMAGCTLNDASIDSKQVNSIDYARSNAGTNGTQNIVQRRRTRRPAQPLVTINNKTNPLAQAAQVTVKTNLNLSSTTVDKVGGKTTELVCIANKIDKTNSCNIDIANAKVAKPPT